MSVPDWLLAQPYAHRGRSSPQTVENSRAAFLGAVRAGMGIELDVHLGVDGSVLVHHDPSLLRMCGLDRPVSSLDRASARTTLLVGAGCVLTLDEVLELVDCQVPVLVELKPQPSAPGALEEAVAGLVDSYSGPVAVIGFDERQLSWFADHRPAVLRGQTGGGSAEDAYLPPERLARVNALEVLEVSRPHFLLYALRLLPHPAVSQLRSQGVPVIGWTARTPEEARSAGGVVDQVLCRGFDPRT